MQPAPQPPAPEPAAPVERSHSFRIREDRLTMRDGVRLAVSYFEPVGAEGERFPVLLELLPYRKDDSFYLRDYPLYAYFARRGFLMAKVDVRGTGGSEGAVPPREYSKQELDDAVELIAQLARLPLANGKVGMWGISWGGFNALQVAMRQPPELGAILALHASDDLYHDDVHYIDGCYHVDEYELTIDHENALPRPPEYALDEAYFRDRFEAEPWLLVYLRQQLDGPFWSEHSLRHAYDRVAVPVYAIGGLLDGYRDTVPRLLEHLKVPVKGVVGPWNHAFPDDGVPGPNYEWRHEAVRWFDHWLRGEDTGIMAEPPLAVFVRSGHGPDAALQTTPGAWRYEEWPMARAQQLPLYPTPGGYLAPTPPGPAAEARLKYVPGYGWAAGLWWGEPTGDMRPDDAGSLVFDSAPLEAPLEILGFPRLALSAALDAPLAHFTVRLEDVQPDGSVALVTGAAANPSQRRSRFEPEPIVPGEPFALEVELHFTTWTFRPGHRIRLAVSNAQFPMLWPTPYPATLALLLGPGGTVLSLPAVPAAERGVPAFRPPQPREQRPGARSIESDYELARFRVVKQTGSGATRVEWGAGGDYEIGGRRYETRESVAYEARDPAPAEASFAGEARHRIALGARRLELETRVEIRSDASAFHVVFTRRIYENGGLVRERVWRERVARRFQ